VIFIEDPVSGRLAVELATAEAWRLIIDRDAILTFEGVPFYPLDAVPGAVAVLDPAALVVAIEAPPDVFGLFAMDLEGLERTPPTPGTGAYFDYDLLLQGGGDIHDQLDGLFEAGAFSHGNVFINNFRVEDAGDEAEIDRLETTFFRDFPERRATFRAGDSLTVGGAFAQPVRFGGLQWSTNFATDPAFVTFPLPSIGGLAEQQSVVDVIVDNLTSITRTVPPGPFAIDNVPVVTGAGEVQLRVTDLLGRERLVTQSYYVSTRLLKAGLHDFSYEAGFKRNDFGERSFAYGDALGTATHRYGFTDTVTGEAHLEAGQDGASLVGGGALLLGPYGLLSGGLGGSVDSGADEGWLGQLAYEYVGRRLSLGARTRFTSDDFRQASSDDGRTRRVDQLNIGYDTGSIGRLGLLFLNRDRINRDDDQSLAASYSLPIGPGALVVNAAQTLSPDSDFALTAAYSIPLGSNRSMTAIADAGDGRNRGRLQYTRTRGASELGLDYRLASEIGDDARPVDAWLGYQASKIGTEVAYERFSGDNRLRLGADGSLAFVDGHFGLTRRIGRAFGLVDLPGFPDVRVYRRQSRGRSDRRRRPPAPARSQPLRAEPDQPRRRGSAHRRRAHHRRDGGGALRPQWHDHRFRHRRRAARHRHPSRSRRPAPAARARPRQRNGRAISGLVARDGFTQLTGPLHAKDLSDRRAGWPPLRLRRAGLRRHRSLARPRRDPLRRLIHSVLRRLLCAIAARPALRRLPVRHDLARLRRRRRRPGRRQHRRDRRLLPDRPPASRWPSSAMAARATATSRGPTAPGSPTTSIPTPPARCPGPTATAVPVPWWRRAAMP
ncbi:MAG: fimbria/pilus outer membrane usher protein, partial [Geminicoccaceae bacterium]